MNKRFLAITFLILNFGTSALFANSQVNTEGGLEIHRLDDKAYFLTLHGVIQADATGFFGKHRDIKDTPGGANLRKAEATLKGGFAKDWTFNMNLDFDSSNSGIINDAFVTYSGFLDNTSVSIGQVPSPFILESANSSKWNPLLERSMVTSAFQSNLGLGASAKAWWDQFALTVALTAPKSSANKDDSSTKHKSDRLTGTARLTFSPVHDQGTVYHLGLSGIYGLRSDTSRDNKAYSGIRFQARPEAVARNTPRLLDTGSTGTEKSGLRGTNFHTYVLEAATRLGPLFLQAESFFAHVHRTEKSNVNFHGHYVQAAYVLTGEAREYDFKNGSFGKVVPSNAKIGAWEIATRYSHLDLNDKDVKGGRGKNLGFGLNWYANKHLKLSSNYIISHIKPSEMASIEKPSEKRTLHIVALRAQLVW